MMRFLSYIFSNEFLLKILLIWCIILVMKVAVDGLDMHHTITTWGDIDLAVKSKN
jgi:hypothetical protein